MRIRVVESLVLAMVVALVVALAIASASAPPSTYSSFDTGPNGYRAIYDVLQSENVPVTRLEAPLGLLDPRVRVLVATAQVIPSALPIQPFIAYDPTDVKRLTQFTQRGGTVVAFGTINGLKKSGRVEYFDVTKYTNLALSKNPERALDVYRAVAGKGLVAFDEHLQGYDTTKSLWSVLPPAVHAAVVLALVAVVLALIDANVRFAPPIAHDPPQDRDSSDYVASMASLLRRANAATAALERFARAFPSSKELRELAAMPHPSGELVLRAATIYINLRKERA